MTFEVIVTSQADADLRGIYEYIAFELLSPDNAAVMPVDIIWCFISRTGMQRF